MAQRACERAEAAESLCLQQQQQLQLQLQQQQRLAEKESASREQLRHLRGDGDARVCAEREVGTAAAVRAIACVAVAFAAIAFAAIARVGNACLRRRGLGSRALWPRRRKQGG